MKRIFALVVLILVPSAARAHTLGSIIGRVVDARSDGSLSGAAVEIDVKPALGVQVILGTMRGQVVRHFDDGIAVEFAVESASLSATIPVTLTIFVRFSIPPGTPTCVSGVHVVSSAT